MVKVVLAVKIKAEYCHGIQGFLNMNYCICVKITFFRLFPMFSIKNTVNYLGKKQSDADSIGGKNYPADNH